MCGFCAVFSGVPHWTETGTDAGVVQPVTGGRDWRLERSYRVRLINAVLTHFGCTLEDWMGGQYILRSHTGRSEVVDYLPGLWAALEDVTRKPADPLDPVLLARLRERLNDEL